MQKKTILALTGLALGGFLLTAAPLPLRADDDHRRDHDRAREAVLRGEVLPLRDILERAEAEFPGRLLEAELEDDHGRLTYEVKLLTEDGRVLELVYDARDGTLLGVEGRDLERRRGHRGWREQDR
ncbi:PepSY domain-containing protein [Rhodospirillum centenum]|uniref:Peptidase propeptide and YPEB domain protein, putative n=1 Tax=Rhodospirillum centenum (strain ATCC 51521 / SW) TaxID=414684 RepID=B6IR25_RHOCS|nr:PepSY domain-containing protein [Rhodospirillum centenum]ACI97911.1 Peptidase propeptide and YPEB domain protein, putative [Rhodospirillum centenum SW]